LPEEYPEELVHVSIAAEPLFDIGPFTVTNSMIGALLASLILLSVAWWVSRNATLVPGRAQAAIEFPFEFIVNIVRGQGGLRWRPIMPLIAGLFLFILIANWIGLLPGVGTVGVMYGGSEHPILRPASADLNFTLGLAIVAFVAFVGWGIRANGVGGYLKELLIANPAYMTPIMTPIHLISEFSRLISLSMRLFGNVFAGEVLLATMLALAGLLVPVIFLGMELVFGLVQALVFALLTMTYITLAMAHGGAGDHAEHGGEAHPPEDAARPQEHPLAGPASS
jgi:F-type H+-transporting ATPase subunit a